MTADPTARSVSADHHRYALILPGNWASIPMDDLEAMKTRVARLVKQQVPRDDRLAPMRRTIRQELLESAGRARSTGASLYALSLELLPGLPFPASLIAFDSDWPPGTPALEDPALRLSAAFDQAQPVEGTTVPAVRRTTLTQRHLNDAETAVLDLEYWFAAPVTGLVCVMVSVPMCPAPEPITQLFDAIAASIHWAIPATAAEAAS